MTRIIARPDKCGACRTCELVCSHHHLRLFRPAAASIEILKDEAAGEVRIQLFETDQLLHRGCDGCSGEAQPLCVTWCPRGALQIKKDKP